MSTTSTKALTFIFITLLIDCTGIGIIIPVLPKLIQELIGGTINQASVYGGWLIFAYAITQFVFAPILGGLSDRYGRRPVLLIALLGLGLDYLFLALAPSIGWLFVGRVIAGGCGASFTTATAYIADISTPEKRAQNFGMVGAAFGVGFIIGPVIGGICGQFGTRIPFVASAVLSLLNFIYGYFILPESLKQENRRKFNWGRANPMGSLLQLFKYENIGGLVICITCLYIAGYAPQATWTYYTMYKFNWTEQWVGYSLGFVGLTIGLVQGGLIRVVMPKLGLRRSVYFGLIMYIIGGVLFSFASAGWMMFAFMIPYSLGGFAGPALQSIVSTKVAANEQGELQGALTSLMSATSVIGPIIMTNLFAYFTSPSAPFQFPGAPFFAAALFTLIGGVFVVRALPGE